MFSGSAADFMAWAWGKGLSGSAAEVMVSAWGKGFAAVVRTEGLRAVLHTLWLGFGANGFRAVLPTLLLRALVLRVSRRHAEGCCGHAVWAGKRRFDVWLKKCLCLYR